MVELVFMYCAIEQLFSAWVEDKMVKTRSELKSGDILNPMGREGCQKYLRFQTDEIFKIIKSLIHKHVILRDMLTYDDNGKSIKFMIHAKSIIDKQNLSMLVSLVPVLSILFFNGLS